MNVAQHVVGTLTADRISGRGRVLRMLRQLQPRALDAPPSLSSPTLDCESKIPTKSHLAWEGVGPGDLFLFFGANPVFARAAHPWLSAHPHLHGRS